MRFAWVAAGAVVVAGACSSGERDRDRDRDRTADCAKVRAVVDEAVKDVPRRYRDQAVRDARAKLEQLALGDATLKRAVIAADATYDGIQRLCTRGTSDRERDCAEVRAHLDGMAFDLVPDADGNGIRDEGLLKALEQRPYHDPAVQAAVRDLVHETGAAFFAPADADAAELARQRARIAYARLAKLCALQPR